MNSTIHSAAKAKKDKKTNLSKYLKCNDKAVNNRLKRIINDVSVEQVMIFNGHNKNSSSMY